MTNQDPFLNVQIGDIVKDEITGLEGAVTARIEFATGCAQVCVQPDLDKEGKVPANHWFDITRIRIKGTAKWLQTLAAMREAAALPPGSMQAPSLSHDNHREP